MYVHDRPDNLEYNDSRLLGQILIIDAHSESSWTGREVVKILGFFLF